MSMFWCLAMATAIVVVPAVVYFGLLYLGEQCDQRWAWIAWMTINVLLLGAALIGLVAALAMAICEIENQ